MYHDFFFYTEMCSSTSASSYMSHEYMEPTHSVSLFADSKEIFSIQVEARHQYSTVIF